MTVNFKVDDDFGKGCRWFSASHIVACVETIANSADVISNPDSSEEAVYRADAEARLAFDTIHLTLATTMCDAYDEMDEVIAVGGLN